MSWTGLAALTLAFSATAKAQDSASAARSRASQTTSDTSSDISASMKSWPVNSRMTARHLIEEYGPPDESTDARLAWNDRGQWSQIRLFREGASDDFPTTHRSIVESTIQYDDPQNKAGELIKFNPALEVDRLSGTLSARSDSEETNILALNLADEIVRNKRDVDSARDFMRDNLSKSMAGKSSPYMDHLLFPVADRWQSQE